MGAARSCAVQALLDRLEGLDATLRRRDRGATQREALDRFDALLPDAIAALRGARERGDAVHAMRLLGALARFLWMRGHTRSVGLCEADATLALARERPANASEMRSGWLGAAQLYYAAAAYDRAREALDALGADGDESADALNQRGMIEREQGRYETSAALHERARARYARERDAWGEAHAISNLAVCAFRAGNPDEAVTLHERALAMRRPITDALGVASSLGNLALLHTNAGRPRVARPLYAESLTLRESLGDAWGEAGSCVALAAVEIACDSPRIALYLLLRASEGFERVGDRLGYAETAEVSAAALLALGAHDAAARALGAADGARAVIAAPVPVSHRAQHERLARALAPYTSALRLGREDGARGDPAPLRADLRCAHERPRRVALAVSVAVGAALVAFTFVRRVTARRTD